MKNEIIKKSFITMKTVIMAGFLILALSGCNQKPEAATENENQEENAEGGLTSVVLTAQQFNALGMKVDTLSKRNFSSVVVANGQLEVLPQNEASVTAIIGANITSIDVFEGKKVNKGQVLAYLSHPDLLNLQTRYLNAWNQLQYTDKEYQRQKRLYEEEVGSGKDFQKVQSDFLSLTGEVRNLEAQLKLLKLDPEKIKQGDIVEQVPVISPINGFIEKVNVKTGQYAEPQMQMFEVINNDHIHADLMVFEKDVYKVKEGQNVTFAIESLPGETLSAKIFAVGKSFEQNPKAVHIHAEIENKKGLLISGMYITGRIATGEDYAFALPEGAIVNEDGKQVIFISEQEGDNWKFEPVEILTGQQEDGIVEIKLLSPLKNGSLVAMNNAYYLLSEMKKGETGEE
ncbi:MAG: efflux RND transporter periplasmic adaptor subunit [Bacteroidales bacterium]|jgi:cobalt-zinc-cadmium efflux system membrane fusion protein|nr:efflux RND transporter periplasmic adaptor subunit [Bacteroidales bacterium]